MRRSSDVFEEVTAVRGGPAIALLVGLPLTLLVMTEVFDLRRKRRSASPA